MGQVFICDWCKEQVDASTTSKINFRKGRAKAGNSWDVCDGCKEEIQMRLIRTELAPAKKKVIESPPQQEEERMTLGDFDEGEKPRREMTNDELAAEIEKLHPQGREQVQNEGDEECIHASRKPGITWVTEEKTLPSGKQTTVKVPHHECRECGKLLKHVSAVRKSRSLTLKTDDGVRFVDGGGRSK